MNSQKTSIIRVAINTPLRKTFDYLPSKEPDCKEIQPGVRVKVPFGKRSLVGIVLSITDQTDIDIAKLKHIEEVLDDTPIFQQNLCDFFLKAAQYYHHPIGEVVFSGLPSTIRQGKQPPKKLNRMENHKNESCDVELNTEQQNAINLIIDSLDTYHCFLLEGITGSGKTQVYLESVSKVIHSQKQALILVPEISLTPQTISRFQKRFGGHVVCFHSQMTPAQRRDVFYQVKEKIASIVIGTRSSLFLPFDALGLIIVDEEHDPSFKQQEGFRYSARDLSVLRAKMLNIPIVLGSATPSFETLYNANNDKYSRLILTKRATESTLPSIELLDVRHNKLNGGLSSQLLEKIKTTLENKKQVLLFINKRGYAPVFMCYDCGWFATCQRCDTRMTLHLSKNQLSCHHCDKRVNIPSMCPECTSENINTVGQGTEKIEHVLTQKFPDHTIVRVDKDTTTKKGNLSSFLSQAQNSEADILIGTQILAKGHHFPNLQLVAIIDADGGLFSIDFRAQERMAQLLIQVSGRAGRDQQQGHVVIQTFHPTHPFMQQIVKQNYRALAESLLDERLGALLPPFSHMALLRASHTKPDEPIQFLESSNHFLKAQLEDSTLQIKGPISSPMPKRQGRYHYQLMIQAKERALLHKVLSKLTHFIEYNKSAKKVRWSLDVDPIEMI